MKPGVSVSVERAAAAQRQVLGANAERGRLADQAGVAATRQAERAQPVEVDGDGALVRSDDPALHEIHLRASR